VRVAVLVGGVSRSIFRPRLLPSFSGPQPRLLQTSSARCSGCDSAQQGTLPCAHAMRMNACFWDTLRVLSVLPSRAPTPVPLATVCPNIHCREVVAKQNMTAMNREPHSLKHTGPAQKNWVEPDTHRHSFKPALHRCLDLLSPCQVNGELAEAVETGDVGKVRTCMPQGQVDQGDGEGGPVREPGQRRGGCAHAACARRLSS